MSRTKKDTPNGKSKRWRIRLKLGHHVKEEARLRKGALKKIELPVKGNYYKKALVDPWKYD